MPIIVLTKKNLLIALLCLALLLGGLFLWLRLREEPKAGETASAMAQVENYELNVLPMKNRELRRINARDIAPDGCQSDRDLIY